MDCGVCGRKQYFGPGWYTDDKVWICRDCARENFGTFGVSKIKKMDYTSLLAYINNKVVCKSDQNGNSELELCKERILFLEKELVEKNNIINKLLDK